MGCVHNIEYYIIFHIKRERTHHQLSSAHYCCYWRMSLLSIKLVITLNKHKMFRQILRIYQSKSLPSRLQTKNTQSICSQWQLIRYNSTKAEQPDQLNASTGTAQPLPSKIDWKPIYRFDNMGMVATVTNLKIYQAIGGVVTSIVFGVGEAMQMLPPSSAIVVAVMGKFFLSYITLCILFIYFVFRSYRLSSGSLSVQCILCKYHWFCICMPENS